MPVAADVRAALGLLGVERLVLGVHDRMLPSLASEENGRGLPLGRGAADFYRFAAELGFDALQFGPQGETTRDNPSPYDSALFSRDPASIALAPLVEADHGALLTADEVQRVAAEAPPGTARAHHAYSFDAGRRCLALALERAERGQASAQRGLREALAEFRRTEGSWLARDGGYAALVAEHGHDDVERWPLADRRQATGGAEGKRQQEIGARQAAAVAFHGFCQFFCDRQHQQLRRSLADLGLGLFGDLQIGMSPRDRWGLHRLFLRDHVMGAPPSRTTAVGQAWGYPLLDPRLYARRFAAHRQPGPAPGLTYMRARLDRMMQAYDGLRIDHPHGWVCPWVYAAAAADDPAAVDGGARLFESPDVPELAELAIARPEQLRRELPRYDDRFVATLDEAQVVEYGELVEEILDGARRAGRTVQNLAWELLSTQPYPLERVLQRHGFGRFRVTQKVRLADPADNYRSELARPEDWLMVGNHDTEPIWAVEDRWSREGTAAARAAYLAERLCPKAEERAAWAQSHRQPLRLAQAQFADLFAAGARHVYIFASDLLGERQPYNRPGTVSPDNWSLRIPRDYRRLYRERLARAEACNLPLALAMALGARGLLQGEAAALAARLAAATGAQ